MTRFVFIKLCLSRTMLLQLSEFLYQLLESFARCKQNSSADREAMKSRNLCLHKVIVTACIPFKSVPNIFTRWYSVVTQLPYFTCRLHYELKELISEATVSAFIVFNRISQPRDWKSDFESAERFGPGAT